jgi:hypothetical protein
LKGAKVVAEIAPLLSGEITV